MAGALAPFACESPDGLEYVGKTVSFLPNEATAPPLPLPSPLADYKVNVPGLNHAGVATAMAGALGTLIVFGLSWSMARVFPRYYPEGATFDAA